MSKKRIREATAIVDKWRPILGLESWEFIYVYSTDYNGAAAEIVTLPQYLRSTLTIYEELFKPYNPVEKILVHEMCHVITEPLYSVGVDFLNGKITSLKDLSFFRELATEQMTRAVLKAKGVKW